MRCGLWRTERKRISQELHDEIGQRLTGTLLQLSGILLDAPLGLQKRLVVLQDRERATLDEVGALAWQLRPGSLDHLGLMSALHALVDSFAPYHQVSVTAELPSEPTPMTPEQELVVYRIAQEALTNAVRHAQATHVQLRISADSNELTLVVVDNGRGLPPGHVEGSGIRGMRERSFLVGGELQISSQAGGGVTVQFHLSHPGHAHDQPSTCSGHTSCGRRSLPGPRRPEGSHRGRRRSPTSQVVAEASDGPEAVAKATTEQIDLVIIDVAMPRMTGLQATREITRRRPTLPVLILSMYDREQYFFDGVPAGAAGYVLKRQADREVIDACREALRGRPFIYPAALSAVMRQYLEQLDRGEQLDSGPLTPREAEVVKLIAEGHSSQEIARLLTISRKTVDRHRENILEKLEIRDRVDVTRYAIRAGLVEL